MIMREELGKKEIISLAPYAMMSNFSLGRRYKETEHASRTVFQRDRDRIIHSNGFRILEYKTQVFVNHEGDYYRTRLTHTLEVSQIARSLSRNLHLNEDLTEAIALAHDLGHTPFGHAGERTLNELTIKEGGFEHNHQSLRVVDFLEERYPEFPGLNLTYEVREGIIRHTSYHDSPESNEFSDDSPTMEAQVVDIADEIAYNNHDIDDGLASGLITEDQFKDLELWSVFNEKINKKYPKISNDIKKYQIIKSIINALIEDVVTQTKKNLSKYKIKNVKDVRKLQNNLVTYSKEMSTKNLELKEFLMSNLYHHYKVLRMTKKSQRFIKALFDLYMSNTDQLPYKIQDKLKSTPKTQVIVDYIAGMTDRFALDEYKKLFDPYEKV